MNDEAGAKLDSRLATPPFRIRARNLTPLDRGGTSYLSDGIVEVDEQGLIARIGTAVGMPDDSDRDASATDEPIPTIDLRPMLLLPGLVDLHAHLPQLPNAGLGAGLDLLTWLDKYIFPLERGFDRAAAERMAPQAFRAFAAAGTTTAVLYGAVYEDSLDACFAAAEAHGIRAVIGKVMMDRLRYDPSVAEAEVL
jgi:guanine deaminase